MYSFHGVSQLWSKRGSTSPILPMKKLKLREIRNLAQFTELASDRMGVNALKPTLFYKIHTLLQSNYFTYPIIQLAEKPRHLSKTWEMKIMVWRLFEQPICETIWAPTKVAVVELEKIRQMWMWSQMTTLFQSLLWAHHFLPKSHQGLVLGFTLYCIPLWSFHNHSWASLYVDFNHWCSAKLVGTGIGEGILICSICQLPSLL